MKPSAYITCATGLCRALAPYNGLPCTAALLDAMDVAAATPYATRNVAQDVQAALQPFVAMQASQVCKCVVPMLHEVVAAEHRSIFRTASSVQYCRALHPLQRAVATNNINELQAWLKCCTPGMLQEQVQEALIMAIWADRIDCANVLADSLDYGIDMLQSLFSAAACNQEALFEALLEKQETLHSFTNGVCFGNFEVATAPCKHDATIDIFGESKLVWELVHDCTTMTLCELICSLNVPNPNLFALLMQRNRFDPNKGYHKTPFVQLCSNSHPQAVACIGIMLNDTLKSAATGTVPLRVDKVDSDGRCAMYTAYRHNNEAALELLLALNPSRITHNAKVSLDDVWQPSLWQPLMPLLRLNQDFEVTLLIVAIMESNVDLALRLVELQSGMEDFSIYQKGHGALTDIGAFEAACYKGHCSVAAKLLAYQGLQSETPLSRGNHRWTGCYRQDGGIKLTHAFEIAMLVHPDCQETFLKASAVAHTGNAAVQFFVAFADKLVLLDDIKRWIQQGKLSFHLPVYAHAPHIALNRAKRTAWHIKQYGGASSREKAEFFSQLCYGWSIPMNAYFKKSATRGNSNIAAVLWVAQRWQQQEKKPDMPPEMWHAIIRFYVTLYIATR